MSKLSNRVKNLSVLYYEYANEAKLLGGLTSRCTEIQRYIDQAVKELTPLEKEEWLLWYSSLEDRRKRLDRDQLIYPYTPHSGLECDVEYSND